MNPDFVFLMANYGLYDERAKLPHCLFLTRKNHLRMLSGLTQAVITNKEAFMIQNFYVAKLSKNEQQQLVAEVQTEHTRFSVIYEYDLGFA